MACGRFEHQEEARLHFDDLTYTMNSLLHYEFVDHTCLGIRLGHDEVPSLLALLLGLPCGNGFEETMQTRRLGVGVGMRGGILLYS